jgi:hypothetical protein
MESKEDIEDFYRKQIEDLDKKFMSSVSSIKKQEIKKIEEDYKKERETIQKEYEKRYLFLLKRQKESAIKEEKKKLQTNRTKKNHESFIVKPLSLKWTKKEKFLGRFDLFWFKTKIKIKNFTRKNTPDFSYLWYIKARISARNNHASIKNMLVRKSEKTKEKIIQEATDLKSLVSKISKQADSSINRIFSWTKTKMAFFKSKKPKVEKERNAEEELLQKILAKKE